MISSCKQGETSGVLQAPPPKKKNWKAKKMVIEANFKLFHPDFATFLVGNMIFSDIFWAGPPPLKNWKAKKNNNKSLSDFRPPPLTNPGHATGL